MKESIRISKLGPLKDVHISDIKPFTIFIGESASGKSTIMKTISLFRWIYKMQNIRTYLNRSKIKSPFRFRMETYFKNSGLDEYINNETEIVYRIDYNENQFYELKFSKKKLNAPNLIDNDFLLYSKISFISENRTIIPLWTSKGASLSGGNLGYYFHEVFKDFLLASEELVNINLNHLNLNFSIKKSYSGISYQIDSLGNDKYSINFKNSSSGTQTSTPIILISKYFAKHYNFEDSFNQSIFNYLSSSGNLTDFKAVKNLKDINKKVYIHIEEPELSLFPDSQCLLIEELVKDCFIENKNETEIILSTHSPYIINYLNLLIKSFDTESNLTQYNFDNLGVYLVGNGTVLNLMMKNKRLVDTNALSETINDIYNKYNNLN